MSYPVLIPVDQSVVQPSMTVAELVEELLEAAGAVRSIHHLNLVRESEPDAEGIRTASFISSARPQFDYDDIGKAGRVVINALYYGKVNGYVRDESDLQHYRIVRDYWRDLDLLDEGSSRKR